MLENNPTHFLLIDWILVFLGVNHMEQPTAGINGAKEDNLNQWHLAAEKLKALV